MSCHVFELVWGYCWKEIWGHYYIPWGHSSTTEKCFLYRNVPIPFSAEECPHSIGLSPFLFEDHLRTVPQGISPAQFPGMFTYLCYNINTEINDAAAFAESSFMALQSASQACHKASDGNLSKCCMIMHHRL